MADFTNAFGNCPHRTGIYRYVDRFEVSKAVYDIPSITVLATMTFLHVRSSHSITTPRVEIVLPTLRHVPSQASLQQLDPS